MTLALRSHIPYVGHPADDACPDCVPAVPRLSAVAPAPTRHDEPAASPRPSGSVTALRPPVNAERAAPVRLTRRGVTVLALAVFAVGAVLMWLAGVSAPSTAASTSRPAGSVVTVRAGDTLWSIATRIAPDTDPRAEVAALQHANRLRGVDLQPGQRLRVP